jgi:hypothetical protein
MTVGPQQFWLGTSRVGQSITFWIDTTTVHRNSTSEIKAYGIRHSP